MRGPAPSRIVTLNLPTHLPQVQSKDDMYAGGGFFAVARGESGALGVSQAGILPGAGLLGPLASLLLRCPALGRLSEVSFPHVILRRSYVIVRRSMQHVRGPSF